MKRAQLSAVSAIILLLFTSAEADTTRKALFKRALENNSTAPSYVLITLVSDGKSRREVCIPAPFLLGAITREQHIDYGKALEIALSTADFTFQFKNPAAIENVQPRYTDAMLAKMRAKLKDQSHSELLAGFHGGRGPLDSLYARYRAEEYSAWRDAIAHVLLDRGLLPGVGDPVGFLTVQE